MKIEFFTFCSALDEAMSLDVPALEPEKVCLQKADFMTPGCAAYQHKEYYMHHDFMERKGISYVTVSFSEKYWKCY
jgi:hypothetical protein